MQWRKQSGIPRVVNEFNLGSLSNETLTSNKKKILLYTCKQINSFSTISNVSLEAQKDKNYQGCWMLKFSIK